MKTRSLVSGTAALALSALLFTSCSNEDDPVPAISSQYVTIAPSVSGEVITRAGSAYGEDGDKLYLYYNTAGSTTANQFADFRYDGTIWDLGTTKMKWSDLHSAAASNPTLPFYATAPIQAPTSAAKVEADQSSTAGYKKSDLLVAYKAVAKATDGKYNALDIDMKHVLAKLTIDVNAKAIDGATINSVTIKGAVPDYTVAYSSSEVTPATTTTVNGSDKVEIKPLANGTVYSAVLPEQAIKKTDGIIIVISVNDKTFTYQPTDAINLQQGKNTTLKLRLSGEGVALGDVTVSEWGKGDTTQGNIEEDPQP